MDRAPKLSFHPLLLRPRDEKAANNFSDYVRSVQHGMAPIIAGICLTIATIVLVLALIGKDFKKLSETGDISAVIMYFFVFLALALDCLCCYLVSRRFKVACEFTVPIFGIFMVLISIPAFKDNYNSESEINKKTFE